MNGVLYCRGFVSCMFVLCCALGTAQASSPRSVFHEMQEALQSADAMAFEIEYEMTGPSVSTGNGKCVVQRQPDGSSKCRIVGIEGKIYFMGERAVISRVTSFAFVHEMNAASFRSEDLNLHTFDREIEMPLKCSTETIKGNFRTSSKWGYFWGAKYLDLLSNPVRLLYEFPSDRTHSKGFETVDGIECEVFEASPSDLDSKNKENGVQTLWIGVEDRLPRKYKKSEQISVYTGPETCFNTVYFRNYDLDAKQIEDISETDISDLELPVLPKNKEECEAARAKIMELKDDNETAESKE